MCENPEGTYDWTEFDRQFNGATAAGLRLMPCMLRLYTSANGFSEWAWAGPVPTGGMQQPPYSSMMDEWGIFCGKVAQRYAGKITAYELWNEPGYDDKGTCTTSVYTTLLNETRPNIRQTENDPNAQVIAFAGCPNLTQAIRHIR